ncbi:MAG: right-handed parallel beta-helix repeat-containing protein [Mucilaginibacter sp.]
MENLDYRVSRPIALTGVHDLTICAYSIKGGPFSCIDLVDCYNIHITQCELTNSDQLGVNLTNCANILIDNCYVANVLTGVHSLNGSNIQVRNNKIKQLRPKGMLVSFENIDTDAAEVSSYAMNNYLD